MAASSRDVPADVIEDDPFDSPGSGEFINWEDHNGALLVFVPKRFEEHIPTAVTKEGSKSPCVVTDVYVLTGDGSKDEDGNALTLGKLWEDQMVFQAFQHRLKGKLPENGNYRFVLARLGQGPKPGAGKNKPWILIDVKENPDDMKTARAWMAEYRRAEEARKAAADPF
jgi:hypothetical protein